MMTVTWAVFYNGYTAGSYRLFICYAINFDNLCDYVKSLSAFLYVSIIIRPFFHLINS